jgi:glycosyltransferase involved in cell wall biosynthesis
MGTKMEIKKKLLCIIGQLGEGGTEKQLYLFLKHLDRQRFEPFVVVSSEMVIDKWRTAFQKLEIPVETLGKLPGPAKLAAFKLKMFKHKPDLVFSWSFYTNAFNLTAGKTPFIGSLRGGLEEECHSLSSVNFKLALSPKAIVVNSKALKSELLETSPATQTELIPNIFEPRFSSSPNRDIMKVKKEARDKLKKNFDFTNASHIISGGGGVSPIKRFKLWFDTFETLSGTLPNIRGILFGDGPPQTLDEHTRSEKLKNKILLTGRLPDVSDILLASDLFFLSSRKEGLPNVLLEAIDAGCAIVSADKYGTMDVFGDDKELLDLSMASSDDSKEIAAKIATLLENPKKCARAAELA